MKRAALIVLSLAVIAGLFHLGRQHEEALREAGWRALVGEETPTPAELARQRQRQALEAAAARARRQQLEPAPTLRRGSKERGQKGLPMATWIVSGAGDSSYNGTYTESGTFEGQPAYTNGSRWLYYGPSFPAWFLGPTKNSEQPPSDAAYYTNSATLPGNPWQLTAGATPPAPSLAEEPVPDPDWPYDFSVFSDGPVDEINGIAPCRATLGGVEYACLFCRNGAGNYGIASYNLAAGTWTWDQFLNTPTGLDSLQSGGLFDAGDGTHLWLCSGVYVDNTSPKIKWRRYKLIPGTSLYED